jgi:hypothetical protein
MKGWLGSFGCVAVVLGCMAAAGPNAAAGDGVRLSAEERACFKEFARDVLACAKPVRRQHPSAAQVRECVAAAKRELDDCLNGPDQCVADCDATLTGALTQCQAQFDTDVPACNFNSACIRDATTMRDACIAGANTAHDACVAACPAP